jgi:hypothetical protein
VPQLAPFAEQRDAQRWSTRTVVLFATFVDMANVKVAKVAVPCCGTVGGGTPYTLAHAA